MTEAGLTVDASVFEYGKKYLLRKNPNAICVDPKSMPLQSGRHLPPTNLTLFGAIRDATPDNWGRRVIENQMQVPPNGLPESVYLLKAGTNRFGALDIRTEIGAEPEATAIPRAVDLQYLVDAADRVEEGTPVPAQLALYLAGAPSLGGARPKATVLDQGKEWIAKFPSKNDPFNIPSVERATLELARSAGIDVPATNLIDLADGRQVMLIERFDRVSIGGITTRKHAVSALTILGLTEQDSPNTSYGQIAEVIEVHGTAGTVAAQREELFSRMVFNILVTNDDDHLRNHAFLHKDGNWNLSPLYDVVPKPQAGGQRFLHLSVGPLGRIATLDNAYQSYGAFGLTPERAEEIIERVVAAVRTWKTVFDGLGVKAGDIRLVETAFRRADDIGMRGVGRRAP